MVNRLKDEMPEGNAEYLTALGITDERLQALAVKSLPCGETSVKACMRDTTSIGVNAVRAIMMINFKGFVYGLRGAQDALQEGGG